MAGRNIEDLNLLWKTQVQFDCTLDLHSDESAKYVLGSIH